MATFYNHNTEIFYPPSNYKYSHDINDDGDNDNDGAVGRELCLKCRQNDFEDSCETVPSKRLQTLNKGHGFTLQRTA